MTAGVRVYVAVLGDPELHGVVLRKNIIATIRILKIPPITVILMISHN